MEHIWAPWRVEYIRMEKSAGCIFCDKPGENKDAANYILFRGEKNFIMLNGYPYNPGHLLVAPFRHVANLEELTGEERNEHFELVSRAIKALRKVYEPGGFNIGSNMSKIAGAGVEGHFHTHIVPRWQGDTNFMTVMDDVRVLPQALAESYDLLKKQF